MRPGLGGVLQRPEVSCPARHQNIPMLFNGSYKSRISGSAKNKQTDPAVRAIKPLSKDILRSTSSSIKLYQGTLGLWQSHMFEAMHQCTCTIVLLPQVMGSKILGYQFEERVVLSRQYFASVNKLLSSRQTTRLTSPKHLVKGSTSSRERGRTENDSIEGFTSSRRQGINFL